MDDAVEVLVPQDSSGIQPLQVQPQEAYMTNLNNAAGQRLYVLQNNQIVVPQENQIIWMESPPAVTAQSPEKPIQAIDHVLQQRMKQQNMLRTLQQVSQPQRQLVQKPCTDEMVRMIGMHNSRLQGVQQQEVQQAKLNKPPGVDAAVGNDTPMELDDVVPNSTAVVQSFQFSKTPRPRSTPSTPNQRPAIRFPLNPRSAICTIGPPLPDTHEQINIINDQKIIRSVSPKGNVEYLIRRQGVQLQAVGNSSKSPGMDMKECKVFMPTSTPGEYQFYSVQDASDRPRILTATPQRPRVFASGPSTPNNVIQLRMSQSPQMSMSAGKPVVRQNATPQRTTCYTPVSRPTTPPRANSPRQYPKSPQNTRAPRLVQISTIRPSSQMVVAQRMKSVEAEKKSEKFVNTSETDSPAPQSKESVTERRYVAGFLAICPFCGFSNLDFSKCERCKRRLPENVKRQPIVPPLVKSQGIQKTSTEDASTTVDDGTPKMMKCASPQSKKRKKVEEPVIYELSSDEEENTEESASNGALLNSQGLAKEPVYTAEDKLRIQPEPEIHVPEEPSEPFTMMFHKAFRVGNYLTKDRKPVYVSAEGIHFTGTSSIYGSDVKVFIKKSSLKAVLVHYNEKEPLMFIYTTRGTAARIRGLLGIINENFLFYDPCSNVQAFKRLILYLERVTDENKIVLENVLGQLLTVIDDSDKQTLMTCVHENIQKPTSEAKLCTFNNFAISKMDYACLADDTYVNDLIIDFYIQYLCERKLSPADRERTHVFSTFFYNRLTDNRENESSKDKPAEKRHKRVKGWTRKVNIFEKDFIIIPINENSHWFLAIICFPYLTGPVRFDDNVPIPQETSTAKKTPARVSVQIGNTTITHCRANEPEEGEIILPSSDRDEAEAEDELSETEGDNEEPVSSQEAPQQEIPLLGTPEPEPESKLKKTTAIKQPCILIFDSLRGSSSRARVVATLRDYLTIEYKTKTGQERVFNKQNIKGSILKVPQQDNYSDCGLFVLQYVESFFENPLTDYRLPIRYLQYWFGENIHNKRKDVAELIQSLMYEQGIDPGLMNLPDLSVRHNMCDDIEEDADMELENDEDEDEEDDDDENYEDPCNHDGVEEGEIPVSTEQADQSVEAQQATPTTSTNPTQLIKKLLPGHGPADGVTRQTLKSIRIQRPALRVAEFELKKMKTD